MKGDTLGSRAPSWRFGKRAHSPGSSPGCPSGEPGNPPFFFLSHSVSPKCVWPCTVSPLLQKSHFQTPAQMGAALESLERDPPSSPPPPRTPLPKRGEQGRRGVICISMKTGTGLWGRGAATTLLQGAPARRLGDGFGAPRRAPPPPARAPPPSPPAFDPRFTTVTSPRRRAQLGGKWQSPGASGAQSAHSATATAAAGRAHRAWH